GQIARAADVLVTLLHHFLSDLLLRGARNRGQARGAIADRSGVALLQLALPCPLASRTLEHAGHHGGGGGGPRGVAGTHRSAPHRRRSALSNSCLGRRTAHAP